MSHIGPTFARELAAAGVQPNGLSWSEDGKVFFSADYPTAHRAKVESVLAAHSPEQTLANTQAAAVREIRDHAERVRAAYYPTGKELDIRRQAPGYTPADLTALDGFIDTTLNVVSSQAALEIRGAATVDALAAIMAGYREMYASEGA